MSKLGQDTSKYSKRIQALEEQHEQDKHLITQLSTIQDTYQLRLEKERNHIAEQYIKQLERQRKELEAANAKNKALEAELATLISARKGPRKNDRIRPPHLQSVSAGSFQEPVFPAPARRQSNLPLPVRPSTPLLSTPVRPPLARDALSAASTLVSSVNSSFSRTSPASSVSSVESETTGSRTPDSPMQAKMQPSLMPQRAHLQQGRGQSREDKKAVSVKSDKTVVITWAERARGNRKP